MQAAGRLHCTHLAKPLNPHAASGTSIGQVMYIGEIASIGRVSVRMLGHHDAIGLNPPARTDPNSGCRMYEHN